MTKLVEINKDDAIKVMENNLKILKECNDSDTFLILSMTPQEDLDNRMKENLPNSKDNKQVEAITEDTSSDTDFSLVGKLPVISDEGEQHSPSSFPLVSVSPQPVAEEEFNEDISADSQI